jgi:hypothetical protein
MAIRELDLVTLTGAVTTDDGVTVPAGTTGAVVGIWAGGAGYEVEFQAGLATVSANQIASCRQHWEDREDDEMTEAELSAMRLGSEFFTADELAALQRP